jgi:hypothetical protein
LLYLQTLFEMYQQRKVLTETSLDAVFDNSSLINSLDNSLDDYISDEVHAPRGSARHEPPLTVSDTYVDFAASKLVETAGSHNEKSITVFNNTRGKMMLFWNQSQTSPFSISPIECEIPPMKSYSFRIKFEPVREFILRHS